MGDSLTTKYKTLLDALPQNPHRWLITGVAGFIGSHLLECLLKLDQRVVGLDNFATGYQHNLDEVKLAVTPEQWQRFSFINGDIRDSSTCRLACQNIDYVLHHAALTSVPASIEDPLLTNTNNLNGFLNILAAAKESGVRRLIYASSSSVYGSLPGLPKTESHEVNLLSPYATTKYANELYASLFERCYGLESIGLRYFNVYGTRQNPSGAYASVIAKWTQELIKEAPVYIYGDGSTTRDFCHVVDVVQANLLAALCDDPNAVGQVYNIASGEAISLNTLYVYLRDQLSKFYPYVKTSQAMYKDFRSGDILHSSADISKAARLLHYSPTLSIHEGLQLL